MWYTIITEEGDILLGKKEVEIMNRVEITGRITKDAVVNNGAARITVAVNEGRGKDGNERTAFIPVTVFGKTAENVAKYAGKGSLVAVEGKISVSYKDDKMYVGVVGSRVEFLATKKPGEKHAEVSEDDIKF